MEHAMLFIETSAKTRFGINQAFEELVLKILDGPALLQSNSENKLGMNKLKINEHRMGDDVCCLEWMMCIIEFKSSIGATRHLQSATFSEVPSSSCC